MTLMTQKGWCVVKLQLIIIIIQQVLHQTLQNIHALKEET